MYRSSLRGIIALVTLLAACGGGNDVDGDGFSTADGDCDDFSVAVNPDADEIVYNGIDDDCDPSTADDDLDGDGAPLARDCDDENADINPDADEVCNGIDDDCDGAVDDDATDAEDWYFDADGDGFGGPVATAFCEAPGAGYLSTGDDCDDVDRDVYPGAPEICDTEDNDCDDLVDADDPDFDPELLGTWYADNDGDGYGDPASPNEACERPAGHVDDDRDCDDKSNAVNPDAAEVCNGIDDNCNTLVDDDAADAGTWYQDVDGDGFGDERFSEQACEAPAGHVADDTDCDPLNAAINPGAVEICNGIDDDCDTLADDADDSLDQSTGVVRYTDADGDGFGDPSTARGYCEPPASTTTDDTDCDDTNAGVRPDAIEVCDDANVDEDCDTLADDADDSVDPSGQTPFYADTDADGFGDVNTRVDACDAPADFVTDATDCDDTQSAVNPGATEVCDDADVDENCNGVADDADDDTDPESQVTYYADADSDGFGDPRTSDEACEQPAGFVTDDSDCDDTQSAINPDATEVCDAGDVDEDCNGLSDDEDEGVDVATLATFYSDRDGDGFGNPDATLELCDAIPDYVADDTDCDDGNPLISPAATEVCDDADVDEDCDTLVDDADDSVDPESQATYFADSDGDGFGDTDSGTDACEQPAGTVLDDSDCDDTQAAINPAATEVCDDADIDENCNGAADDADEDLDLTSATTWFEDLDSDLYGNDAVSQLACERPVGFAEEGGDCDDAAGFVNPGAVEVCDDVDLDENCDGLSDDDDPSVDATTQSTFYADTDTDGYGDASNSLDACDLPAGYLTDSSDCDDTSAQVNPGALEVCNAIDDDCDTLTDDADDTVDVSTFSTFFADSDGDGFGDAAVTEEACAPSAGFVADATDCDDTASATNPEAVDVPNDGIDQDCDGSDAPYAVSDLVAGDLVITEIMKDPDAVADADGEWFEIQNVSGGNVDLDGLFVEDLGTDSFEVTGSLVVAVDGYVVFGINDDPTTNGDVVVDYAYSGMDLDETDDEIALYTADGGVLIDEVSYDDVDFPSTTGESLTLTPTFDHLDNDAGSSWCSGTSAYGSGSDLGTPGASNDSC
ncbi:MAG: lamin tail domain-containing protein [Myxococcales bacterium]|nr:lamin tail domain-containing protein [Myxococcales bacterium]